MRSLQHAFPAGKLPLRGQFRVTCMAITIADMTNVRRIQRYLAAKMKVEKAENLTNSLPNQTDNPVPTSFLRLLSTFLVSCLNPYWGFVQFQLANHCFLQGSHKFMAHNSPRLFLAGEREAAGPQDQQPGPKKPARGWGEDNCFFILALDQDKD